MTQDDIIRMAREAGLIQYVQVEKTCVSNALERFAALVAAPVRTKDLTDDEIKAAYESWWESNGNHAFPIWVGAKAVIAAYKEKQK